MCKKFEVQQDAVDTLYERLRGEVVERLLLLFDERDGVLDLTGAAAVTDGDTLNLFKVSNEGRVTYDGAPIRFSSRGRRGIERLTGEKALTVSEWLALVA